MVSPSDLKPERTIRALEPALWNNEARVTAAFQGVLDDLERRWGRAGA